MAASQWLLGQFERATAISSRVQGVYSPVAAVRGQGVKRTGTAWMGTPEIYFAKSIDNSRLVKVADPERAKEMKMFSAALACLFVLTMFYAWQHFSGIEYGYKIEAQKKQREELVEMNRAARLEEASLRDPERIDVLARQLGLEIPRAGQVVRMEASTETGTPILASAHTSGVAVVTLAQ